jgi:hypothetical protein
MGDITTNWVTLNLSNEHLICGFAVYSKKHQSIAACIRGHGTAKVTSQNGDWYGRLSGTVNDSWDGILETGAA